MLRVFVVFLLFSISQAGAANHLPVSFKQKGTSLSVAAVDTLRFISKESISQTKFIYAELYYQRIYTENKLFVNGNSLSEVFTKSIADSKYKSVALDLMGAVGWELTSTIYREIREGHEIIFYFKKRID